MSALPWKQGIDLSGFTSWRIGGRCFALAEPQTIDELREVYRAAAREGKPLLHLGGGTNVLVADEGFPGIVVRYGTREPLAEPDGATGRLRVGAGIPLARIARRTAQEGWVGLAWAEGIPGSVGGAIVGNAGAYGGEISQVLESVELVHRDGERETREARALEYGYRSSALRGRERNGPAVVAATFRLSPGDPAEQRREVERIAAERRRRTPAGASCGSVFRNPPGESAGRLIDRAGCKGMRRGGAVVSAIHANYIVNEGGARARDVLDLIDDVRLQVGKQFGIDLELEIVLVGFAPTT